jgi:DNA polymerase-3 subunit epsilon
MPTKIIYLDTETTGLNARRCGIVQLAAILDIDGQEVDSINLHMRPADGLEISDEALAVSGTSREDMAGFPSEREGHAAFLRWLGKHIDKFAKTDKAFFSGYNSPFDVEFVRAWFDRCGDKYFGSWFWSGTIDVMGAALWALRDRRAALPNFKLGTVADVVLGSRVAELTAEAGLHNALTDIRITRELHQRITQ